MKKLPKENRAGLYTTIIVHLVVIIALLIAGISGELSKETSFVIDFSKVEEVERLQKELALKEAVSQRLDQLIAAETGAPVKNISVDNAGKLKDDRGTDAEKLYEDARRLEEELRRHNKSDDEAVAEEVRPKKEEKPTEEQHYSGPSVLEWSMEGRKASKLPIPAYRCMGAGTVKVLVATNPQGDIITASVDESCSSTDACLRSFAIRAARMSKFNKKADAPAKQHGWIVYQFIAQ